MQHNRAGRKLRRTTSHRRSLFRNQLASLFAHERITTTLAKAKELRPLAEKLVTLGKRGGLHARRLVLKTLPNPEAVGRLFDEIAPRFAGRSGGYTRIMKLGKRAGDAAETAIIEFVDFDFATRKAEKAASKKAAAEKKETLLERARKLVTGKGAKAEGAAEETAEPAKDVAEKTENAEKAAKPARRAAPKATKKSDGETKVKAPRGSGGSKKGPTKGSTPRKSG